MRLTGAAVAMVLVVGLQATARADSAACQDAVAVRVNSSGLAFVGKVLRAKIPASISLPAASKEVFTWPLSRRVVTVKVPKATVNIDVKSLELKMIDSALHVQGKANIKAASDVEVVNAYSVLGTADCKANVDLKDLTLDLGLKLSTSNGDIKAKVTRAKLDLDNEDSALALGGCTLGTVMTAVVTFLRKHFFGFIQSKLEGIAKDKLPPLLASKLQGALDISRDVKGFKVKAELDRISTDAKGLEASVGLGIETSGTTPSCLAGVSSAELRAPSCIGVRPKLAATDDAMFGAGVSGALLAHAVHAAWRSGKLCIDSTQLKNPAISEQLDGMAAKLGQPRGTKLSFQLRLGKAPRLRITAARGIELAIRDLSLAMTMAVPGRSPSKVTLHSEIVVAVRPWIDPTTNSVAMDLNHMSMNRLEIKGGAGGELAMDPARLSRFIADVGVPLIRERLRSAQLSPAVIGVKDYAAVLKSFRAADGFVALQLDAYDLTPTGDKQPPQTVVSNAPNGVVGPKVLQLHATGTDNKTPKVLLQFKARVDGGKWSKPAYGSRVDVSVAGGRHLVEVAAVDHDGNVDPTPVRLDVTVDDVPPQLRIVHRPPSLMGGEPLSVRFTARDDRTPYAKLKFVAELWEVSADGGMPQRRTVKPVEPSAHGVSFGRLHDGVYKVRIKVTDEADNVTSEDVGVVIHDQGGCSAAGGAPAASGLAMLWLLLLAAARRRHHN